jgi:hypothetical protein
MASAVCLLSVADSPTHRKISNIGSVHRPFRWCSSSSVVNVATLQPDLPFLTPPGLSTELLKVKEAPAEQEAWIFFCT